MKISGTLITLLSWVMLGSGETIIEMLDYNCGTVGPGNSFRIKGGYTTSILNHPWMAHIRTKICTGNYNCQVFQCGGTLITRDFVLSAAHCDFNIPTTTVTLGQTDISRPSKSGFKVGIVAHISHPDYAPDDLHRNDIALIRLARTVQYTDSIKPICLTNYPHLLEETLYLTATGWGLTESGAVSNVLKRTKLKQYTRESCTIENLYPSQICAGDPYSDTCGGDSGGPITGLYNIDGRNRIVQLGIVSFGFQGCNGVGAYTNVMHFYDWIAGIVGRATPPTTQRPVYSRPQFPAQTRGPVYSSPQFPAPNPGPGYSRPQYPWPNLNGVDLFTPNYNYWLNG